jgi:hypothetical protein
MRGRDIKALEMKPLRRERESVQLRVSQEKVWVYTSLSTPLINYNICKTIDKVL